MVGFIQENDMTYAGRHLLIDLYGCPNVHTTESIRTRLEQVCTDIGATVLFSHAHEFNNGGSSGAVILAESHCTWHHWVEEGFIALDIFVCGTCNPEDAIFSLNKFFNPTHVKTDLRLRGVIHTLEMT